MDWASRPLRPGGGESYVLRIEEALSAALKQRRLTNVDVDGVKADVSLTAERGGRRSHDCALLQGAYSRQQCRRQPWARSPPNQFRP